MKALLGDTVIAEAPQEDLIKIEGNWYFPPSSVNSDLLVESATPYTCPWKGECQYFSVKDDAIVAKNTDPIKVSVYLVTKKNLKLLMLYNLSVFCRLRFSTVKARKFSGIERILQSG